MAGAEEFVERLRHLEDAIGGSGKIVAGCEVNQPYAQNQHENLSFHHEIGKSHYLGEPLMQNSFMITSEIARGAITEEGSKIPEIMRDIANDMAKWVFENAPRDPDVGDVLANSGSPFVTDNGVEVYRRPPIEPRRIGPSASGWHRRGRRG